MSWFYIPGLSDIAGALTNIAGSISSFATMATFYFRSTAELIAMFLDWLGATMRQSWDALANWLSSTVGNGIKWLISVTIPPVIDQAVSISTWFYNALEPMVRQVECAFTGFVASIRRKFIKIVQYNFTILFLRDSFRAGIRGGIGGILTVFMGMFFAPFAGLMAAQVLDQLVPEPSGGACLEMTPSLPEKGALTSPAYPPAQPPPGPSMTVGFVPENADMTWSPISDSAQVPVANYILGDNTTSTFTE